MMPERIVLSGLRPYYGRIAVLPSDVDEEERPSGIIVPFELEDGLQRGVVLDIDILEGDLSEEYRSARISVGSVVYFHGGWKIGDTYFIDSQDIIAFEAQP
jgi:co-chaperonin GroES (HSP10)